jgi:glycosyltransferase involved in cell wall biosynthesis
MNVLFIHQDFPGQFKFLAPALAESKGWHVVAVGQRPINGAAFPGIRYFTYGQLPPLDPPQYPPLEQFVSHVRRGRALANLLRQLADQGFRPDLVVAHPGWGEALFLHDVFPNAPLIAYLEFYYRAQHSDLDFDLEFPVSSADLEFLRLRNLTNLLAFETATVSVSPTEWQAGLFPPNLRSRIRILHEGVDTGLASPSDSAVVRLPQDRVLTRKDEVLTYVARGLEPYRGFHMLMRALPEIQKRRPDLFTVVVGADEVCYGSRPASGRSWRETLMAEVGPELDMSRIWFAGMLPYSRYLDVLRVSTVHLYLTYPFVLSWSLLEAMSVGCTIVASNTPPVTEVIVGGETGKLVGFFDRDALVLAIDALLQDPKQRTRLGAAARAHIVDRYDFRTRALPSYLALFEEIAPQSRPKSSDPVMR